MQRKRIRRAFSYAVVLCVVMAVITGVSPSHSRVFAANIIKIGLLEEPKTLNVLRASDRWSRKVLSQIYQHLYIRDPKTLEFVPWLAAEAPVFDEATLSYIVKLRPARWSDGSELTSEDVAYTAELIKEFKVPGYLSRWRFIKKIETPDKQTVRFYLTEPKAIFLSRTLTTPIVSKKEWMAVAEAARGAEKPETTLLNHKITNPISSGPFVLKEWRKGAYLYVEKNKYFFGTGQKINGMKLGPYIDGIIFKFFGTADAAVLALKKGDIDMFWWGIQPGYLEDLIKDKVLEIFKNERSALYYMGFNVRKKPFSDPNFRRAVATLIDKEFIITRILQGYGAKMDSIIPSGNRAWFCPDVPRYGVGLKRGERIRAAYEMLRNGGYAWKVPPVQPDGSVAKADGIMLPDGSPMESFTILTPPADYDPMRAMAGMLVQEWLRELGIPASAKPMAFGALIQQVKVRHEFDAFILGYGALSLDPDYLRNFFYSGNDKPRGWNMSGYKNPEFDRIADESSKTMDQGKRRKLICEMQQMVLRDVPYIPLYDPDLIEAVRKGEFTGWVPMLEGIGNLWSFCLVKPQ